MPIIVLIAVIALIVVIIVNLGSQRVGNAYGSPPDLTVQHRASNKPCEHTLAFISGGKLFYQAPGQELCELQSPHVQAVTDRMERSRQLHGWKEGTAFARSFTGRNPRNAADGVSLQVSSAQFVAHDRVVYFLRDDSVGGCSNTTSRRAPKSACCTSRTCPWRTSGRVLTAARSCVRSRAIAVSPTSLSWTLTATVIAS
jgi:hypothetical protein